MKKASEEMVFKKAAKIRNQINAINRVIEIQCMDIKALSSRDVIVFMKVLAATQWLVCCFYRRST